MSSKREVFVVSWILLCGAASLAACEDGDDEPSCVPLSVTDDGAAERPTARWLAFDSDRGTLNRDLYLARDDGTHLTRLTTEPSFEKDPAFSHDGKMLAFASDRSGSMQIHVMDLTRGGIVQLTSLAAGADQPSWSHDNARIVFHSGPSIYVMDADGGEPEVVATGLDNFNAYEYPSFTHDDQEVIFSRRNEINTRNLRTGAQRNVVPNWTTTEETPAMSPNGQLVAFAVGCDFLEVISVAPFSGHRGDPCTAQRMTPPFAGSARRPAWATNDVMAFERSATFGDFTTAVISVSEAPGSTPRDIVGPPGDNRNPSWAPEGFDPQQICL